MENAAEALKMAAAVLIFVLALSISINSFSEVRQTSQTILNYRDREYDTTYVEDNGSTERIVGAETIIPTIYKSYKENYKIIFDFESYEFDCLYGYESFGEEEEEIRSGFEILGVRFVNKNGILKYFNGNAVKESLGVYYQEDVDSETKSEISEVNKTEKRVIIYSDP